MIKAFARVLIIISLFFGYNTFSLAQSNVIDGQIEDFSKNSIFIDIEDNLSWEEIDTIRNNLVLQFSEIYVSYTPETIKFDQASNFLVADYNNGDIIFLEKDSLSSRQDLMLILNKKDNFTAYVQATASYTGSAKINILSKTTRKKDFFPNSYPLILNMTSNESKIPEEDKNTNWDFGVFFKDSFNN